MISCSECGVISFQLSSPIGNILIESCSRGLHLITQSASIDDSNFDDIVGKSPTLEYDMNTNKLKESHPIINECVEWLSLYFSDPQLVCSHTLPKICPSMTPGNFKDRVWISLAENIIPGKTVSYKDLAEMVNSPGGARAVVSAMRANPFQIIVPCHRVLPSNGTLGNYASGKKNKVKAWLLHHEGISPLKS